MSNKEAGGKLEIRAYPIAEPKGNILGSATIALDTPIGNLAVRDIRIVNGQNGPFVAMPQAKDKDGNYKDLVFPTASSFPARCSGSMTLPPARSWRRSPPTATARPCWSLRLADISCGS